MKEVVIDGLTYVPLRELEKAEKAIRTLEYQLNNTRTFPITTGETLQVVAVEPYYDIHNSMVKIVLCKSGSGINPYTAPNTKFKPGDKLKVTFV